MKRRTFLQTSAVAPMIANTAKGYAAQHQELKPKIMGKPANIDASRLENRNQNRSTVVARNGIATSSQAIASSVGLNILRSGGNAVDSAIAMNAMLALTEPAMCGPGGDLFAIVWNARDKKLYGLNASGRSPYAWNRERAKEYGYTDSLPILGPHTWSVPGCVSGWDALHSRFGKLKWSEVIEPAMNYANEGYMVGEIMAAGWDGIEGEERDSTLAQTYLVNGKAPRYGQIFANPALGHFYGILARDGAKAFYEGEIAERIVKFSEERGGLFSMRDFEDHKATWVDPVTTIYRGYNVWELPPNGQGIAALQIMNMLEHFDIGSMEPNSAEQIHLFLEAKKLAFEDRAVYYADMEKADVPVEWLISKEYGKKRVKLIDPRRASTNVKPGKLDGSSDTTFLCASDSEGNMVSLIQSIYWGWGSKEVPDNLGFCLQNRGRAFSLDPNHRNTLEPHKRPFHTIIPGFLTKDGDPQAAFGVMGGDFQPQGHAQVLMNMIDFGMTPQQAGEQPRAEHLGSSQPWSGTMEEGGSIQLEQGFDEKTIFKLIDMGHIVESVGHGRYGGYQCIWREDEPLRYMAGSEPRKDGCAIGW